MSANSQIIGRLRSESDDGLTRLLGLYAPDGETVKLIKKEQERRRTKAAQKKFRQFHTPKS
ncbi:hypothetical protein [Hymenobacter fodinae]|uniref:Uncharacterized protein n=1 Tax=Hymenobacter fodinae TaxID=2510796 RepID=A0A4Z0P8K5_9BACT|nr:hypothetical protein [Hymenobacter fodinae]TGE07727.1 hypothetical protein EU556_08210 [Hymenobacter fodinae]